MSLKQINALKKARQDQDEEEVDAGSLVDKPKAQKQQQQNLFDLLGAEDDATPKSQQPKQNKKKANTKQKAAEVQAEKKEEVEPGNDANNNNKNNNNAKTEDKNPKQPTQENTAKKQQPANNSKNKNKNKNKKKEEEEDIDKILQDINASGKGPEIRAVSVVQPNTNALLSPNVKYLNPETELKRNFGAKYIDDELRKESKRAMNRKVVFVRPKNNWPRVPPGIQMDLIKTENGLSYFTFVWSPAYSQVQTLFREVSLTHDPSMIANMLHQHPYHVDSLLQLSEVLKQTGEFERSGEFIEQCIFVYENAFHPSFIPASSNNRIDFNREENRGFYLAIFRFMNINVRRGCPRTSLELCKFLLSLSPETDPLFLTLCIDDFALRSGEYDYLLRFASEYERKDLISNLPNFAFSVALAKFLLEIQQQELAKTKKTSSSSSSSSAVEEKIVVTPYHSMSSDELIQSALIKFPMVLTELLEKSKSNVSATNAAGKSVEVRTEGFFSGSLFYPPSLKHLVSIFAERSQTNWKAPNILEWLSRNCTIVLKKVEEKDPIIESSLQQLKTFYSDTKSNVFHDLGLTDYTEALATLPPEVANAVFREEHGVPLPLPAPVVPANTTNPLSLFLSTLLPWNTVPNAPAVGYNPQVEQNRPGWLSNFDVNGLIEAIQTQFSFTQNNTDPASTPASSEKQNDHDKTE